MKKALSIILSLCIAVAILFVAVSCGKTETETTTTVSSSTVTPEYKLSPAERAAVDEVLKDFYTEPEKRDEGVYEEDEYGTAVTYEYDKNRNLVKATNEDGYSVTYEYAKLFIPL